MRVIRFTGILVAIVVVIELLFASFDPYRHLPASSDATRNPEQQWGWPEYTAHPKLEEERLVVIISNSQACAWEYASESTYPGLLRQKQGTRKGLRIENWSMGGMRLADLEVLARKAALNGADEVYFVLNTYNFDVPDVVSLDYAVTDVKLIPEQLSQANYYSNALFRESQTSDQRITNWFYAYSSVVRLKTFIQNKLSRRIPMAYQIMIFGKYIQARMKVGMNIDADLKSRFMREAQNIEQQASNRFNAYKRVMNRLLAAKKEYRWTTEYNYIIQPRASWDKVYSKAFNESYDRTAQQEAESRFIKLVSKNPIEGLTLHNWSFRFPNNGFSTNSPSHFNEYGHKLMADALWKEVNP